MSAKALLMLISAEAAITAFTVYFFWKVVTTPPKPAPDSFPDSGNI